MLKTHVDNQIRLVQQHHHAQVSGYLAAHWGGGDGFTAPGHYPGSPHPGKLREETILGIAEHDNGWWEWEAIPRISPRDGLPVGLGEKVEGPEPAELAQWRSGGFERWRVGIGRLAGPHPYAALLVSLHAYWLYAVEFPDLAPPPGDPLRHFLFHGGGGAPSLVGDPAATRAFLEEQREYQAALKRRLEEDAALAGAAAPELTAPHLRLLQLLDTLSLYLALNDEDSHVLEEVPRASWRDRVSLHWRRLDSRVIALDPYPFDADPLPVHVPARLLPSGGDPAPMPYAALHGAPMRILEFHITSGA